MSIWHQYKPTPKAYAFTPAPPAANPLHPIGFVIVGVPGATVTLDFGDGPYNPARITDDAGYCCFPNVPRTLQASHVWVTAPGYTPYDHHVDMLSDWPGHDFFIGQASVGPNQSVLDPIGLVKAFPAVPTRAQLLNGQSTQQGLIVHTTEFGDMPWWGACWAWLTKEDRALAAEQLLVQGDTICLIQVALDGRVLYNEANQFYSPDKFGPLTHSISDTVALVEEALQLGFSGVWLFLDGDDGQNGYPIAIAQTKTLGPALAASTFGDLNTYVVQLPGWDGVWHKPDPSSGTGYTPSQIAQFADTALAFGAHYVGIEQGVGYALAGGGARDYQPGGCMNRYALMLLEFNDDQFDGTVWQILARCLPPGSYIRPADQPTDPKDPQSDLPPHPYYVVNGAAVRCFEYYIYGCTHQTPDAQNRAHTAKAKFAAMGCTDIC